MDYVKSFGKGQLGIYLVAVTSCDSKLRACGRAYKGCVKKVTLMKNARLGCEYSNFIAAKGGTNFTPAPLKGMEWIDYPYFKRSLGSGKIYLSLNYRDCDERTKPESYLLVNGVALSKDERDEFEEAYFTASSRGYSNKQAAAGIVNECEQTKVVQYCLDDVKYLGNSLAAAREVILGMI